jgi:hypothetical protein
LEEAKAKPALDSIRATDDALQKIMDAARNTTGLVDPKGKEFHKSQAGQLKQLESAVKAMKKSWPDAPSTKEALEIADKYGLSLK